MTVYVPGTGETDSKKQNMSLQALGAAQAVDEANIATNTTNIATNTASIATNTTAIALINTGVIPGTTTNNNAAAGNIGEYISSTIASGSAVSLTTSTLANVTSISLTAGDWDVYAQIIYSLAATTSISAQVGSTSATSVTMDTTPGREYIIRNAAFVPGGDISAPPITSRFSLAGTTTVFLVAQLNFTVSTAGAYGIIRARRVR